MTFVTWSVMGCVVLVQVFCNGIIKKYFVTTFSTQFIVILSDSFLSYWSK